MKIIADKQILLATISPAVAFTSNKATIAVIEGILFKTVGSTECEISAYDLEKGFYTSMGCVVEEPGCFAISAGKLVSIVKTMPDGAITISVNDKNLRVTVSGGHSTMEMSAMSGEKFPLFPEFSGDRSFMIGQKDLKNMFLKTQFAIADNSDKPELNGLFVKVENGEISCVSCDRNRIAIYNENKQLENLGERELSFGVIIPGKAISEIIRFLSDTDKKIKVIISVKHVIFIFDKFTVFTRIIDADFIDYPRFLPKAPKIFVELDAGEFTSSLERAMLITEEKLQGQLKPAVICTFRQDVLTVFSQSVMGKVNDEIATVHDGEEIEIGFNCRLLYEAMKACDTERVKFSLTTPLTGMLVEPVIDDENKHFTMLILPVRLS